MIETRVQDHANQDKVSNAIKARVARAFQLEPAKWCGTYWVVQGSPHPITGESRAYSVSLDHHSVEGIYCPCRDYEHYCRPRNIGCKHVLRATIDQAKTRAALTSKGKGVAA